MFAMSCNAPAKLSCVLPYTLWQVHVDPGMRDGQKIVFAGEGDQEPGIEPGDVIFVLDEKEDKVFRRQGSDLFMHMVRTYVCVEQRQCCVFGIPVCAHVSNLWSVL